MEYLLRHGNRHEYGAVLSTMARQNWTTSPHTEAHPLGMAVFHAGSFVEDDRYIKPLVIIRETYISLGSAHSIFWIKEEYAHAR